MLTWENTVSSHMSCAAAVCDMCLTSACSPPAGWLCSSDRTGRHSSALLGVFIVTLWSNVTTPSLSMIFYQSWLQGTTSLHLTRGTAGKWILLSLQISPLDQIALFAFASQDQWAALQRCLKYVTTLSHGGTLQMICANNVCICQPDCERSEQFVLLCTM